MSRGWQSRSEVCEVDTIGKTIRVGPMNLMQAKGLVRFERPEDERPGKIRTEGTRLSRRSP